MSAPEITRRYEVPRAMNGARLDHALDELVPELTRAQLQKLVRRGRVQLRGKTVRRSNLTVQTRDLIELRDDESNVAAGPPPEARILHVDDDLIVVDKPAGLLVHPTKRLTPDTLADQVARAYGPLPLEMGDQRPGIIHRLDRETSGVMLVARSERGMRDLRRQFRARSIGKRYLALAHQVPDPPRGTIQAAIEPDRRHSDRQRVARSGKPSQTEYEVVEAFGCASLVACKPRTGRRHQIRVHLAHIGCRVAGDRLYGAPATLDPDDPGAPRMRRHALHAARIEFEHPANGERIGFEAELPADIASALDWLRARVD